MIFEKRINHGEHGAHGDIHLFFFSEGVERLGKLLNSFRSLCFPRGPRAPRGSNGFFGMFLFLFMLPWTGTAMADWNLESLMRALAERPAGQARFVETKTSDILREPIKTSGTLSYKRPAFLQKHVRTPFEEILSVDGNQLTWEKPAANKRHVLSLRDYPAIWGFIESMRATLNGDAKTLQRFYRMRLDGNEQQWTLLLLPSDPDMAQHIRVIRISGSRARITTVEIEDAGGDRSLMTLQEDGK